MREGKSNGKEVNETYLKKDRMKKNKAKTLDVAWDPDQDRTIGYSSKRLVLKFFAVAGR